MIGGLTELELVVQAFHFLRPWWLVLLIPVGAIWWRVRSTAARQDDPGRGLAPHLSAALTVGRFSDRKSLPIDSTALILGCCILGAAGPTWSRQADPFLAQTGPVVVVLKVTPSMMSPDVAPNRLERAKFKIRDLLDLRAGAQTALVAYSGTAHRVLPFTKDPGVMQPYLEGLTPDIMPGEGTNLGAALALAAEVLNTHDTPGGILVSLDRIDAQAATDLANMAGIPVAVHLIAPAGSDTSRVPSDISVVEVSADDGDIRQLDRILNVAYRRALLDDEAQPWEDRGWWFAVPAALLALFWFRRGWTMRWAAMVLGLLTTVVSPSQARADGIAGWFLTPDQQAYRAYRNKEPSLAADLFQDPMWRGYALFRAGRYQEAIEVLARIETAHASFTMGLAQIRNRNYRDAIRSFELTLQRDPEFPGAAENLQIAKNIADYVDAAREASDTGEGRGIGADDIVFDNEQARGEETQIQGEPGQDPGLLTAEQWKNTIDTSTGDFLRMRFLLEAAGGQQ